MERLNFETLFRVVRWDYNRCFKDESLDKNLFMEGEFVCSDDWQAMREQAVRLAYRQEKKVSISAIKYEGTDEDPVIKEGQPIMQFSKHNDTVYIVGGID